MRNIYRQILTNLSRFESIKRELASVRIFRFARSEKKNATATGVIGTDENISHVIYEMINEQIGHLHDICSPQRQRWPN